MHNPNNIIEHHKSNEQIEEDRSFISQSTRIIVIFFNLHYMGCYIIHTQRDNNIDLFISYVINTRQHRKPTT